MRIHRNALLVTVLAAGFALPVCAAEDARAKIPGFVDGKRFLEVAGRDADTVEVNLHGPLLRVLLAFDPELKQLASGLESIHAVVLTLERSQDVARVRDLVRRTEAQLLEQGWERLARVKDEEAHVTVMVLNDEKSVQGLCVMVLDDDGEEMVFANIAGTIDLAAIARLGESLEIPGLDQLGR